MTSAIPASRCGTSSACGRAAGRRNPRASVLPHPSSSGRCSPPGAAGSSRRCAERVRSPSARPRARRPRRQGRARRHHRASRGRRSRAHARQGRGRSVRGHEGRVPASSGGAAVEHAPRCVVDANGCGTTCPFRSRPRASACRFHGRRHRAVRVRAARSGGPVRSASGGTPRRRTSRDGTPPRTREAARRGCTPPAVRRFLATP